MERHGADVIDIGGESARPGAKEVAIQEELERNIPLIQKLRQGTVLIRWHFCVHRSSNHVHARFLFFFNLFSFFFFIHKLKTTHHAHSIGHLHFY
jgi:hypothetical protein